MIRQYKPKMQTTYAGVILKGAARLMGWDPALLEDVEHAQLHEAFSEALQDVWEAWWWDDLMQCQTVALAPLFRTDNTPTTGLWPEGYPVYEPISNWYYVCLTPGGVATPPIDPNNPYTTTPNPNSWNLAGLGYFNIDFANWAPWREPVRLTEWVNNVTFNLGDQTQRLGVRYQSIVNNNLGNDPQNNETFWLMVPDMELTLPFADPGPGNEVDLRGPFGVPKSFSRMDPRRTPNAGDYPFEPNGAVGNRVVGLCRGHGAVWADIRRPTPVLAVGSVWFPDIGTFDETAIYTPVPTQDMIYDQ